MDTIRLKTKELLTYHCGCLGNLVTMAARYVASAYCLKESPYQIWTQYNLRQWSNKCRVKYQESSTCLHEVFRPYKCKNFDLQSVSWILAEFYFNRGLQRLYTVTCIILQKTVNGFLCLLIVFLKSKTCRLILKDVIKLNRNLR